jgi:uncharacterized RDD family membrane protein YckC
MDEQSTTGAPAAGLLRRIAALAYDCLPLFAILFVGTVAVLPLTGGEAITPATEGLAAYLAYRAFLALLALGYFGLAWTRGGQTIGMMAWKIRLVDRGAHAPGWPTALWRFAFGFVLAVAAESGLRLAYEPGAAASGIAAGLLLLPLAANFAWIPFDPQRRSLQDLACGTRMLRTRVSAHAPDRDGGNHGQ